MPKSLADARVRSEILDRLERLKPSATPAWGKMNAPQMLAHLVDWMLMANGELKTAPIYRSFRYPPLKQLVIYWIPFPKGVPTAPELIRRAPPDWGREYAAIRTHLAAYDKLGRDIPWALHPLFGRLTSREWGVLGYRHTDHHFRQFGI